jgi:hypothetical protein
LVEQKDVRCRTKEILERFEAHLRAVDQFTVWLSSFSIFTLPPYSLSCSGSVVLTLSHLMAGDCTHERK